MCADDSTHGVPAACTAEAPRLARAIALTAEMIARAHPGRPPDTPGKLRLLSDEERAVSLARFLETHPPGKDICVFGYGSLMWNPEPVMVDPRPAAVEGWQRRFCLWQWRWRGTIEKPGLMLAIDRGGRCDGLLYRIPAPDLHTRMGPLWKREMSANGYRAEWVEALTPSGLVRALTFIANVASERYAGALDEAAAARHIATACGHYGPSAEYLLLTVTRAAELGIDDPVLWRLQGLVAAHLRGEGA